MNYKTIKKGFKLLTIAVMITSIIGCSSPQAKPIIYNYQLNEEEIKQPQKLEKTNGKITYHADKRKSEVKVIYKISNDFELATCLKLSDIDLNNVFKILNENSKNELIKKSENDLGLNYENDEFKVKFETCQLRNSNILYNYKITIQSKTVTTANLLDDSGYYLENILIFPFFIVAMGFYGIYRGVVYLQR